MGSASARVFVFAGGFEKEGRPGSLLVLLEHT